METYDVNSRRAEKQDSVIFPMVRVYAYIALALLITALVAFGLPYLLVGMGWQAAYAPIIVVSVLAMLPCMIIISLKSYKPKSIAVITCFVIYAIAMGALLSSIFLIYEFNDIFLAFAISAGTFGLMALVGGLTKRSLDGLWPLVFVAIIGSLIISLVNVFFFNEAIYWITEFVCFGAILLMTAIDMNRCKRMALARGLDGDNNIAIYCAFNLYVDFIYIFIRVLYFVGLSRRN